MQTIVVDASLSEKLREVDTAVLVRDADGTILGQFQPDPSTFDRTDPDPLTEEELQRRESEPGGRELAEILADWEKRLGA